MAQSVLQALLQGAAEVLQISRDDIDGQIGGGIVGGKASVILIDAVPGGAGYAELIANKLPQIVSAARRLTSDCECGPETSCYQCLRTFWNQRLHELLARGLAAQYLGAVMADFVGGLSSDEQWSRVFRQSDPLFAPVALALEARHVPVPILRFEFGRDSWPLEWAWPSLRVAMVISDDTERDAALASENWTVIDARTEDTQALVESVLSAFAGTT